MSFCGALGRPPHAGWTPARGDPAGPAATAPRGSERVPLRKSLSLLSRRLPSPQTPCVPPLLQSGATGLCSLPSLPPRPWENRDSFSSGDAVLMGWRKLGMGRPDLGPSLAGSTPSPGVSPSQPQEPQTCGLREARGLCFFRGLGEGRPPAWGGLLPLPHAHFKQKKSWENHFGGRTLWKESLGPPPLSLYNKEGWRELKERRAFIWGSFKSGPLLPAFSPDYCSLGDVWIWGGCVWRLSEDPPYVGSLRSGLHAVEKNPPWSEFISYRFGEDRKLRSLMVKGGLTLRPCLPLSLSRKLEQRAEARGQNGVGARTEHAVESSRAPPNILHAVWAGKKRSPRPECVPSQCPAPETCPAHPKSRLPGRGEGPRGQEGPLAGGRARGFGFHLPGPGPGVRGALGCARRRSPRAALGRRPASTKDPALPSFEINSTSHKGSGSP